MSTVWSGCFHSLFFVTLVVSSAIGFTSCSSVPSIGLPPTLPTSAELKGLSRSDLLGPGDIVEVRVYREPELTGLYHVGVDGRFSFPLIGDVQADQGGVYELTTEITKRLKQEYIRDPQVTVLLKETRSKKIFVLGLVKKPGSYVFESRMTIVQAIALAGGLQKLASKELVLIRSQDDGKELKFRIPFKQISRGQAPNSLLQPGDIVFVPESWY